jgi:nitrate/nitrite transporter NarK
VTAALALYRLAEFGPWAAMLVVACSRAGAVATGAASLGLLAPTALFARPMVGPLIDWSGSSRVLLAGYIAPCVTMASNAASH